MYSRAFKRAGCTAFAVYCPCWPLTRYQSTLPYPPTFLEICSHICIYICTETYTLRPWRWRQHVFAKRRQHPPYPYSVNPRTELTLVAEIIQWYTWRVSLGCFSFTHWYRRHRRLEPFCGELDLDLNLWTVARKILWTVSSPNILERHHHGLHAMFWLSSVGQVKQHVVAALRDLTCPSLPNLTFSGFPPFPADDLLAHRQYI